MQQRFSRTGFDRAAKERQARFRQDSATISDDAKHPTDDKGMRNSHLLALGHEEENLFPGIRGGEAIDFFRQRNIKWWRNPRSGDDTDIDGPTRNMASSQVACVNFLLPLAGISGALVAALCALDDDVRVVVDIAHDRRVTPVEFEWLGLPHSLEGGGTRGTQNTSVDAFLVAETASGRRRAYLMEWKYVEQYLRTRPEFKGTGKAGDTRRRRYADAYRAPFSSFNHETAPDLDDFLYEPFYQIMRQRLLADRMVRTGELDVDEARVVIVAPEDNRAYRLISDGRAVTSPPLARRFPQLGTVDEVMRACLKDPDSQFRMVSPSLLLEGVVRSLPEETEVWACYWRERYGV